MTDHIPVNTPAYIYDGARIRDNITKLREALPQFEILYSVKANPFPPLVRYIASQTIGADAASRNEVLLACDAGISPEHIYYSGPGKTKTDLEETFDSCILIADSFHELELINQIAQARGITKEVGIRINPDFTMNEGTGCPAKFGIDEELCTNEAFAAYSSIVIAGIHVHVQSQELDWEKICRYYENVFRLAVRIRRELRHPLSFINFGSGIGVPYQETDNPVNLAALQKRAAAITETYRQEISAKLLIESGRFLVCEAGTYVTEVLDIKRSRGRTYLIVAGGLNGFVRPAAAALLTPDHAPAEPIFTAKDAWRITSDSAAEETVPVTIVGNLCTASDILAENIRLPRPAIGDRITFTHAGSYACTLSPQLFGSQKKPEEVFLSPAPLSH